LNYEAKKGNDMKGQQLSHMLTLATQRHDGQFDKGGMPYILHPLKVMHYMRTDDEELQCIALGHDLIEDTFQSVREGMQFLSTRGFSERVVRGIADLSKVDGEDFERYKERVKANPDAVAVKMADLRHNSDIRRLKGVTPKDIERIEKYHRFYLELRDLTPNVI
jgi:(p)ppGpp synthase/HD superfamily hydrolase